MRVLFVSTSYPRDAADWRGLFMRHLVGALAKVTTIELKVWAPPGELPPNVETTTTAGERDWLIRLMKAGGISHLLRARPAAMLTAPIALLRMLAAVYRRQTDIDLYHINWLQCALPLPNNGIPALISVLGNDLKLLRLPMMRGLVRRSMRGRQVIICPNAEWMHGVLDAAFGDVAAIVPVSFGIDRIWFSMRREPADGACNWLAVTRLTKNKLGPLFEWSEPLFSGTTRSLHLFGPMQEQIALPDWVHYHGAATPDQLVNWFSRAHGLISLSSHAEGRPQVMLEAMAAGLPIVASRIEAHTSIVTDNETGMLCDSMDSFEQALRIVESRPENLRLGLAAREKAKREYGDWDSCAERYATLYRNLLATHPPSINGPT